MLKKRETHLLLLCLWQSQPDVGLLGGAHPAEHDRVRGTQERCGIHDCRSLLWLHEPHPPQLVYAQAHDPVQDLLGAPQLSGVTERGARADKPAARYTAHGGDPVRYHLPPRRDHPYMSDRRIIHHPQRHYQLAQVRAAADLHPHGFLRRRCIVFGILSSGLRKTCCLCSGMVFSVRLPSL
jgi:hypothetical protein